MDNLSSLLVSPNQIILNSMQYNEYKKIPNHLRKCRVESGFKQKQVAKILGMRDASQISQWENGSRLPSLVNAFRLAALYSTYVDRLFQDHLHALRSEVKARARTVLEQGEAQSE